jgi:hypothetical protein
MARRERPQQLDEYGRKADEQYGAAKCEQQSPAPTGGDVFAQRDTSAVCTGPKRPMIFIA